MDYIEINRNAYDQLAKEYDERTHEIDDNFWHNLYQEINIKQNLNILEIGPGNGRNIGILKEYDSKITTVELSEKMCEIIKNKFRDVEVINENILKCNFKEKSYDIIFISAVIHNFPLDDAKKLLNKINTWLKDDGYMVISTTINDVETEGIFEKKDYKNNIKRYRHKYTKQSFERLLYETNFDIFKPYIKKENDRNKLWYVISCSKSKR